MLRNGETVNYWRHIIQLSSAGRGENIKSEWLLLTWISEYQASYI